MNERTVYKQLQSEERMVISSMKLMGESTRAIARVLSRPASSISREMQRNSCALLGYTSDCARALHARRRSAASLKRVFPSEPERHVSHETIYTAIYAQPRGELRRQLVACLRQGRSTRLPRSCGTDRRGQIPDMVNIHVRPPEVDDRVMPGHWEGDFIKGAGNQFSAGVLVERTSRLVLLARMHDATAASALAGFTAKLNSIPLPMRQSLTYDQGKEMSRHADLAAATGVRVYFCDPHSPWQRGTCENTNGLLRQYLPKGTDRSIYTQDELDAIADSMNSRPRATHNWRTPLEVFGQTLANFHRPPTSIQ